MTIKKILSILAHRPQEHENERRARLLNNMVGGALILVFLALLTTLILYPPGSEKITGQIDLLYFALPLALIAGATILALNRWTSVELAATVFLIILVAALSLADAQLQAIGWQTDVLFAIPVLAASLLLRPRASFVFAGASSLGLLLGRIQTPASASDILAVVVLFALALLTWLSGRGVARTIKLSIDSSARFRSLYGGMTEAVTLYELIYDSSGKAINYRVLDCNPAFTHITGIEHEQAVGELGTKVYDREIAPFLETYAKVVETGEPAHIETYFAKTGKYLSLSVFSPEKSLVATVAIDITERKKAEEALENSEKRFRALIENSAETIVLTDTAGVIKYMSPAYARMMGRNIAQRIGKSCFEHIHPEDKDAISQLLYDLLQNPQEARQATVRLRHQNGTWHWMEFTATNLLAEPVIQSIVVNMHDVTEQHHAEEEICHHLTVLEVLTENSASLGRLLDPKKIGQKILDIISKKLAWHHAAIRIYHPETRTVEILALSHPGLSTAELEEQLSRLNQVINRPHKGLSGWVIEHGKPVRSGQVRKDSRYLETYPDIRSGIYIPIQINERTIGSIAVESEAENAFSEQDENLLAALASQAAIAFENARLYQGALRAAERHSILHRASQEIVAAGLDLEAVYTAIHQAATELMTVDIFTIGLYDTEQNEVEAVFLLDDGRRYPNKCSPLGRGFMGLAIQNRQTVSLRDRQKEMPEQTVSFKTKTKARSILVVPMFVGNAAIGAISIQSRKAGEYDEEDESLLEMLTAHAGTAIENARLFDQTQRRADELGALASVSSALRTALTQEEIIPVILDHITNLFTASDAALSITDPATGESVIEQARGNWAHAAGMRLKVGEGLSGQMAETHLPYQNSNVSEKEELPFADFPILDKAVAGVPLMVQGQFTGSLWVGRRAAEEEKTHSPLTSDEMRLLESIADMAASSLHRAMLHEQAIQHAEQLKTVNEIGHVLGATLELDQIYSRLTDRIYNLVPDLCGIFISLYDRPTQALTRVCGHLHGAFLDAGELPPLPFDQSGEECQSYVILSGEPLIVNDLEARPALNLIPQSINGNGATEKSGLYVPMIVRGVTIGLIQLLSPTKNRFGQKETNLLSLVANTAAIAIENARLLSETQKRLHNLSALHTIDTAISASVDMRVTLNILLEQTVAELKVDAAAVLLAKPLTRTLEYAVCHGFRAHIVNGMRIQLGSGVAGQAALKRQMQNNSDQSGRLPLQESQKSLQGIYQGEGFVTHYAVPLVAKGQVQGVLEVFHRSPFQPDEEWLTFLDMLAGEAAIAIDNGRLFEDLQRSNLDMVLAYDATIQGWSQALELRDKETEGHTQRVTDLTVRLAQAVGIPNVELEHVRRGALLHDIGKMGIPDSILLKPDTLTKEEWEIMRQHPQHAYDMLSPIAYLRPSLDIPHYHHERWDGSGYPSGLAGEQIPLYARVFAVVDVYDALTSDRPYRPAWTAVKAIEYIRENSGKLFDPHIVATFLDLISREA